MHLTTFDPLQAFWVEFLKLIDEAPEKGSGPKSKGSADSAPKNEKDAGKNIPKVSPSLPSSQFSFSVLRMTYSWKLNGKVR